MARSRGGTRPDIALLPEKQHCADGPRQDRRVARGRAGRAGWLKRPAAVLGWLRFPSVGVMEQNPKSLVSHFGSQNLMTPNFVSDLSRDRCQSHGLGRREARSVLEVIPEADTSRREARS